MPLVTIVPSARAFGNPCTVSASSDVADLNLRTLIKINHDLSEYAGIPYDVTLHETHLAQVLDGPDLALEKALELIDRAQAHIDVELYDIGQDRYSRALLTELVKKARSLQKVFYLARTNKTRMALQNPETDNTFVIRLLLDYKHAKIPPQEAQELISEGVQVRYFNRPSIFHPFLRRRRDHRQLLIADDTALLQGERAIAVQGAIAYPIDQSYMAFWALKDNVLKGSYASLPKTASSNRKDDARDFFSASNEDPQFTDWLSNLRKTSSAELALTPPKPVAAVIFKSDPPASSKLGKEIFSSLSRSRTESSESNEKLCITTLKSPHDSRYRSSQAEICLDELGD